MNVFLPSVKQEPKSAVRTAVKKLVRNALLHTLINVWVKGVIVVPPALRHEKRISILYLRIGFIADKGGFILRYFESVVFGICTTSWKLEAIFFSKAGKKGVERQNYKANIPF
mmetsp:Transcript_1058/g.1317  ORF Transcript_1058/g.1317 Transcript_1058/m.1317 type:complete len:113 (+) Transcript_1058:346-684(+)